MSDTICGPLTTPNRKWSCQDCDFSTTKMIPILKHRRDEPDHTIRQEITS